MTSVRFESLMRLLELAGFRHANAVAWVSGFEVVDFGDTYGLFHVSASGEATQDQTLYDYANILAWMKSITVLN